MSNFSIMSNFETRVRAVGMLEGGKTQVEVANVLSVSERSVRYWWHRHKSGKSLKDCPRSGRPKTVSRVAKIVMKKAVGKRGQSTRKLAARLTRAGHPVSRETVRRHFKIELGLKFYHRPRKALLTQLMRDARIKFAKDHLKWSFKEWSNVIWSDECYFHLFPTSNRATDRIWASNSEEIEAVRSIKHSPKVMVWGMFSTQGVSQLHFVPSGQTVNAQYYRENILAKEGLEAIKRTRRTGSIIEKKLVSSMSKALFMQDSAPAHVTKDNYNWLDLNFQKY